MVIGNMKQYLLMSRNYVIREENINSLTTIDIMDII